MYFFGKFFLFFIYLFIFNFSFILVSNNFFVPSSEQWSHSGFIVFVFPSVLKWLPSFFVKKYLKNKHADVILKAPDGRTWSVKYTFGVHEETPEGKFLFGWKAFSMANDLKVGDVCVFVLTKSTDILFEVYIFRENGNSTMLPGTHEICTITFYNTTIRNHIFLHMVLFGFSVSPVHKAATSKVRPKGSLSSKVEAGNTINKKTEMSAPETCRKPLTINKKARALETASGYQSENPFFTVTLGASYTTKRRYLVSSLFKSTGWMINCVVSRLPWKSVFPFLLNLFFPNHFTPRNNSFPCIWAEHPIQVCNHTH